MDEQLAHDGYVIDAENPDFLIGYNALIIDRITAQTIHDNYSYGAGWGYTYYGLNYNTGPSRTVTTFEEGSLVVDILNPADRTLMWRGLAQVELEHGARHRIVGGPVGVQVTVQRTCRLELAGAAADVRCEGPGARGKVGCENRVQRGAQRALQDESADDEMDPGQFGLGHLHFGFDLGAVERVAEDVLDPLPDQGVVAIAGDVDQAGEEPTEGIATHEKPDLLALLQVEDAVGDPAQEILKLIDEEKVDLVIMASHGQKGHYRFGSVTDKVLKNSPVPVTTIPVDAE